MKVKDLIKELQKHNQDADVFLRVEDEVEYNPQVEIMMNGYVRIGR